MSLRPLVFALPFALLAGAFSCARAQSASPVPPDSVLPASGNADVNGLKVREIHPRPLRTPIPIDTPTSAAETLEFRAPEQMTAADRELADASQTEIARRAGLQLLGFHGVVGPGTEPGFGSWGYEQAVCPVFPDHLVLEYSRTNSRGDVSMFSAVVPRGEGHIRVIPVERRGYSLFTPAEANSLTVSAFNHIVKEEHRGLSSDWLMLGMCYASFAGGHVRAAIAAQVPEAEKFPLAAPAMLKVSYKKAGADIYFADIAPDKNHKAWVLSFSGDGRLEKVKLAAARELQIRPVPGAVIEERGVPVNGNIIELPVPKAGN